MNWQEELIGVREGGGDRSLAECKALGDLGVADDRG